MGDVDMGQGARAIPGESSRRGAMWTGHWPSRQCVRWGGGGDSGGECEIVDGLSGDEMDPALIIPGGRAARRGRAASGNPYLTAPPSRKPTNPYAGADSDDDDF